MHESCPSESLRLMRIPHGVAMNTARGVRDARGVQDKFIPSESLRLICVLSNPIPEIRYGLAALPARRSG